MFLLILQGPRVSLVRPVSSLGHADSSEMLEMVSEGEPSPSSGLGRHTSQILLYKPQNAHARNNTAGSFHDSPSKDFKRVINLNSGAPGPRTLLPSPHVDRGGDPPTVLV